MRAATTDTTETARLRAALTAAEQALAIHDERSDTYQCPICGAEGHRPLTHEPRCPFAAADGNEKAPEHRPSGASALRVEVWQAPPGEVTVPVDLAL